MFDQEQIGLFLQRLLMVAGGFGAGYLLTWLACVGFDKTVIKGKSPDGLHKWARRIGGAVVALVVAFFLFRGGTGTGDGTGNGANTGTATGPTSQQTTQSPNTTPLPPKVEVDTAPVYVTVYAGKAVEANSEKFYALGDPPGGKVKLDDVTAAVQAAKKDKKGVLLVYTLDDTASTGTQPFNVLEAEAKRLGVELVSRAGFEKLMRK